MRPILTPVAALHVRLFYRGRSGVDLVPRLAIFDLDTNTGTHVVVPSSSSFIEYDTGSGPVLSTSGTDVIAIDPATGNATFVAPMPFTGVSEGMSTFDHRNRVLDYRGQNGVDIAHRLATLRIVTGEGSNVVVPGTFGTPRFPRWGWWGLVFFVAVTAVAGALRVM